jgi:rSAM/selenodomain-associated transferase 1
MTVCLLVVAKAPVPGLAKTRLCPPATPEQAAEIAAAALLDTLDTVLATPGVLPVVAMTGELDAAARRTELTALLARCTVFPQRGKDFATRLANAHLDTARRHPGTPVFQIGMDTPQLTTAVLTDALRALTTERTDAVLGPALDGGWWSLGLRDPRHGSALRDVAMSTSDTGRHTREALEHRGLRVDLLPELSDVDVLSDAVLVAETVPASRFAAAVSRITRTGVAR